MRRCRPGFVVALALALYWLMAVSVSPHTGVTADEVVHLTGGYSYWKFDDYRLHPENGTLPMRLAALPLLGLPLQFSPLDTRDWLTSKVDRVGYTFFWDLGNPVATMLQRGRMVIALTGALAIWLTWCWTRRLFGAAAGWVALGLAVFSPTMLAHGGLATSDMTLAACLLGALSVVWRLLHRVTWPRLALATLACGATFLAKMSGVLLVPVCVLLLVTRWLQPAPLLLALGRTPRRVRGRAAVAGVTLGVAAAVGAGSIGVLWAGYGCRYEAANRARSGFEDFYLPWDVILERAPIPHTPPGVLAPMLTPAPPLRPTAMTRLIGVLRDHRLLPEAYLWGFAHTYKFSRERPAFFHGAVSRTGWRWFFPAAFLLKTTLPVLGLFCGGLLLLTRGLWRPDRRMRRQLYRAAPLALFSALYGGLALASHLNIGHRHILPLYPVVFILAGGAAAWLGHRLGRRADWLLGGLLTLHAADSLAARPIYLSYFQPLAGGPDRGYRYLVDSSCDWGQGLPDFATWLGQLRASGDRELVYLTYFGADSPRRRGLGVVLFGDAINDRGARVYPAQVHGGWFAISATHFQRVYLPTRGPWTRGHERLYRELMQRLGAAEQRPTSEAATETLLDEAESYETFQFGRLSHFLHGRQPERVIGGSILVFHLTEAEVRFALYAPWEDFQSCLR